MWMLKRGKCYKVQAAAVGKRGATLEVGGMLDIDPCLLHQIALNI